MKLTDLRCTLTWHSYSTLGH